MTMSPALINTPPRSDSSVDVLTFTSPSTVREVAAALGEHSDAVTEGFVIACIGPITGDAAKARGWPVHVMPDDYTADGLVDALRAYYTGGS